MKNPAATIKRAGELMFGRHWKQEFADTFDLSVGTVRNIAKGKGGVSPSLLAQVETALHDHGHALDDLLADFVEAPDGA